MDAELIRTLETILAEKPEVYAVGERLKAELGDTPPPDAQEIRIAFDYWYSDPENDAARARHGLFGPQIETSTFAYPPPLNTVDDGVLKVWVTLLDAVGDDLVQARFHDLLWERRYGDRDAHKHARAAIQAYLRLADSRPDWMPTNRSNAVVRALELAQSLNDSSVVATVAQTALRLATEALDAGPGVPGVPLSLLGAVVRLPRQSQPEAIDDLLARAVDRYPNDPWLAQSALDLQILRAGSDRDARNNLMDAIVSRWIAAADQAEGLVRLSHLERASELANAYGLADKQALIATKIQAISIEDLNFQTISATVDMPRDEAEAYVNWFVAEGDWQLSLVRIGNRCPFPDDRQETRTFIENLMRDSPLRLLAQGSVQGPGNVPLRWADFERARLTGAWSGRHVAILLRQDGAEHRRYIAGLAARRCLDREANGPGSATHLLSPAQLVVEIASYPPDDTVPVEVLQRFDTMVTVPLRRERRPRNEYERNAGYEHVLARVFAKIVGGTNAMPFRQWLHPRRDDWHEITEAAEHLCATQIP